MEVLSYKLYTESPSMMQEEKLMVMVNLSGSGWFVDCGKDLLAGVTLSSGRFVGRRLFKL